MSSFASLISLCLSLIKMTRGIFKWSHLALPGVSLLGGNEEYKMLIEKCVSFLCSNLNTACLSTYHLTAIHPLSAFIVILGTTHVLCHVKYQTRKYISWFFAILLFGVWDLLSRNIPNLCMAYLDCFIAQVSQLSELRMLEQCCNFL